MTAAVLKYVGPCPVHPRSNPGRLCAHCEAQMRRGEHHGVPIYRALHWPAPERAHG